MPKIKYIEELNHVPLPLWRGPGLPGAEVSERLATLKNKISLILPMFIWNRNQTSSLGFVYIHNRKTGSWKIAWYRDIFYYDDLRRILKERKELNDEIIGVGTSFVSPCYLPY